jgi:hypothetical protein
VIEAKSRFIIWAESATIDQREDDSRSQARDPRGRGLVSAVDAIDRVAASGGASHGPRSSRARSNGAARHRSEVLLRRPRESSLWQNRLVHRRTSGKLPRTTANRSSRSTTPRRWRGTSSAAPAGVLAREQEAPLPRSRVHLFMAYRNLVRRRFNFDQESPAEASRLYLPRRITARRRRSSWMQEWGHEKEVFTAGVAGRESVAAIRAARQRGGRRGVRGAGAKLSPQPLPPHGTESSTG